MLNRRDFAKLTLGTGAAVIAAPGSAFAQAVRPNITVAVDNLWSNLNTILGISTTTQRFFSNIYSHLIERDFLADPQGVTLKPGLATEWSREGKIWTIKLREGVKFHNGQTMTAEDVAFTLGSERLWGAEPFEPRGKTFTEGFVRVEAVGPLTVEIETAQEDGNIPGKLTGYIGLVVPKAAYLEMTPAKFGQMPIGTGPYKVTEFRASEVLVMEAFDDYWDGPPPAAKVTWKIVPEFAGRMAGVVSGEFDFICNIPTDQEPQLESYDNVTVARALAGNYPAIALNTLPEEGNPLVDIRLRKALIQAADMDAIIAALFDNKTFHPKVPFNFPDYGDYYDEDRPNPLPYDPEAAKKLVEESDYKGEPIIWHITRGFYPNYEAAAEILVEMWRQVGLNVVAQVLDNFDLVYEKPFSMMSVSFSTEFIPGDPYQPLWLNWNPNNGLVMGKQKVWVPTEEFMAAGAAFNSTVDFAQRKEAYLKLSQAWQDVTPAFYLWKSVYNWAHRADYTFIARPDGEMRMFGDYLTLPS